MRILTISNCPAVEHLGSGYVISGFTNGLRALGHEVHALQPNDYETFKWMRPRATSYRQAFGMWREAERALRRSEYDVIEFYGGEAWLATRFLAKENGPRPLIVQHTNGPEPRYERLLDDYFGVHRRKWFQFSRGSLMKAAFTRADSLVTVSKFDHDWLVASNYQPAERVLEIENPLPETFFAPQETGVREKIIGYCGTWLPKKGIHVLSKDITRVLLEFPEYRVLLIGVGQSFNKGHVFPGVDPERIEVIPFIASKEELRAQYDRMEIFVFPSVIESFGIALAEAMARGCAAVTTKVGLGASLIHREQALLLDETESPLLYDAVRLLITDSQMRGEIAKNARERVQGLRWPNAVRTLEKKYEHWLAIHRSKQNQCNLL